MSQDVRFNRRTSEAAGPENGALEEPRSTFYRMTTGSAENASHDHFAGSRKVLEASRNTPRKPHGGESDTTCEEANNISGGFRAVFEFTGKASSSPTAEMEMIWNGIVSKKAFNQSANIPNPAMKRQRTTSTARGGLHPTGAETNLPRRRRISLTHNQPDTAGATVMALDENNAHLFLNRRNHPLHAAKLAQKATLNPTHLSRHKRAPLADITNVAITHATDAAPIRRVPKTRRAFLGVGRKRSASAGDAPLRGAQRHSAAILTDEQRRAVTAPFLNPETAANAPTRLLVPDPVITFRLPEFGAAGLGSAIGGGPWGGEMLSALMESHARNRRDALETEAEARRGDRGAVVQEEARAELDDQRL